MCEEWQMTRYYILFVLIDVINPVSLPGDIHLCCWVLINRMNFCCFFPLYSCFFVFFKRMSWVKRQFWSGTMKPTLPKERVFSLNRWKSLLNGSRTLRKVSTSPSPFFCLCQSVFLLLSRTARGCYKTWHGFALNNRFTPCIFIFFLPHF